MLFKIERASILFTPYGETPEKPCEEAFLFGKENEWVVEFSNLDDLVCFTSTYGRCIINEDKIKIYDDYVE